MAENLSPGMDIEKHQLPSSDEDLPIEKPQGPPDFPDGGRRAWSVAIGCSGILFCTFGYINAFGVYQEYYQTHMLSDHTPSQIAWIGSLQVFFLFSGSLFGGPLFDRLGAKILWPGALLYIFSVMMTSLCTQYYQFMLAQGVLGGLMAGMSMAPGIAAVGQYFHKKRGAAMGIAVAGSSLGGVILPIALNNMLSNARLGFGWTVRIVGFLMLAIIVPSVAAIRARLPPRKKSFFVLSAFKEPHYCLLIGGVVLIMMGLFTPFFYIPTYAVDHGMSVRLAFYLTAILNAASFFGRVIPGFAADRFGRLNLFSAAAISSGILCFCWQRITTNAGMIVFAALFGFTSGAIVSLMSVAFAQVPKNPQNIGTYIGMGMFIVSLGALIGPPVNGALVTRYSSYDQAADFSGVLIIVGGFVLFFSKRFTEQGLFAKN